MQQDFADLYLDLLLAAGTIALCKRTVVQHNKPPEIPVNVILA